MLSYINSSLFKNLVPFTPSEVKKSSNCKIACKVELHYQYPKNSQVQRHISAQQIS